MVNGSGMGLVQFLAEVAATPMTTVAIATDNGRDAALLVLTTDPGSHLAVCLTSAQIAHLVSSSSNLARRSAMRSAQNEAISVRHPLLKIVSGAG